MNRMLKILLAIIAVLIIVFVGGYIIIKSYLTPQTIKNIAERLSTEAIQNPVEIGRVGLHFGFRIGITVDSIVVTNAKGFSKEPMAVIDKATVNFKILPLLRRRIVISSLDFKGMSVRIERNKQKKINFAALIPKEAKGSTWSLSLSSINISKGDVYYLDEISKTEIHLKDIDQHIKFKGHDISAHGKNTVYILKNKTLPEMIVEVTNDVTYDTLKKNIRIKKVTAKYDPVLLKLKGDIKDMEVLDIAAECAIDDMSRVLSLIPADSRPEKLSGAFKAACSIKGKTTNISISGQSEFKNITFAPKGFLRGFEKINGSFSFTDKAIKDIVLDGTFGKGDLKITGAVDDFNNPYLNIKAICRGDLNDLEMLTKDMENVKLKGGLDIEVAVKGRAKNPSYDGRFSIKNGFVDGIGLAKPISNLMLSGKFETNTARIDKCGGSIGKSDFSFSGKVTNFSKPVIDIHNVSHLIDLDEIIPAPEKRKTQTGKAAPITLKGTTKIDRFVGADMEFMNINTAFNYTEAVIDLKNCSADAFDGQVYFDLYYNANSPEPYRINTRMTSISTKKILKRFLNFDNLEGKLNGISNFQGRGFTKNDVLTNLSSSGNIKITKGVFRNFTFFTKLLAWLGMKTYEVVNFNDFVVDFSIDKGTVKVRDWALSSEVGEFLLNGTIGLNGNINLGIAVTLIKKYSDIVKKYHGEWIFPIDSKGQATIDIKATGSFKSPTFTLDKDKIKQRIKGKVKNEFENKKKEWETKIKNLLKQ
jgi:uncharacterized membrane protein